MADSFTFADRVQAVLAGCSCLSCFSTNHLDDQLSADEADTLSLHSHLAGSHRGSQYESKHMSLFGWDVFGKRGSRIQLPDSDEENDEVSLFRSRSKSRQRREHDPGAESTSTFDSDADASPLDASLIDARAAEEAERRQKELEKAERRRLRRERRELRRMAMATSFQDNGEFEGFPGSGHGAAKLTPSPRPANPSPQQQPTEHDGDDVDLDGGVYLGHSSSRGGSRSNSDSRSRSSASRSTDGAQFAFYNHQQQTTPHHPQSIVDSQAPPLSNKRPKKSSKSIHSSSSATASVSLPSPEPADDRSFRPFIRGQDHHNEDDDYESRFPSVGFAGAPGIERKGSLRDQGGILAQSGF